MMGFKALLSQLKHTPLHPQWLVFREERKARQTAVYNAKGTILDIGCANQYIKRLLSLESHYIGMDYPGTVDTLYKTKPMLFGDAQILPVATESIDTVLLLEVLEHIPDTDATVSEIYRVLKREGCFVISMPFLYPIHDTPYDFQRLTIYGLRQLLNKHNLAISEEMNMGQPVETAALLFNLAISKTVINAIAQKNVLSILIFILPFLIPVVNIIGWGIGRIGPRDSFMPNGYLVIARKKCL